MSHSHMGFEHLMKQVELYEQRRGKRDNRPEWLCQLIDDAADLFNPESDIARVGFDCVWDGEKWQLSMFLGAVEVVGGSDDGAQEFVNFEFDLLTMFNHLDEVERLTVGSRANDQANTGIEPMFQVHGSVQGENISITILSKPPVECSAAMKRYADGRLETV